MNIFYHRNLDRCTFVHSFPLSDIWKCYSRLQRYFYWQTWISPEGETGSTGGTHEVVLSEGVVPVIPVYDTRGGEPALCWPIGNSKPLWNTHHQAFSDSSSNSEAAITQACPGMLVLKKQLPLLISKLPLHRNGYCWHKNAVYNHFTISSRFLITSSDHSRPLPRWSPTPNTAARCQEKACNACGSLQKAPFPPADLQREEGPTATTHRKLSVPLVTCPL